MCLIQEHMKVTQINIEKIKFHVIYAVHTVLERFTSIHIKVTCEQQFQILDNLPCSLNRAKAARFRLEKIRFHVIGFVHTVLENLFGPLCPPSPPVSLLEWTYTRLFYLLVVALVSRAKP